MDKYAISLNSRNEKQDEKNLEIFLRLLLDNIEKWVVVFLLHYDQIDNVYQFNVDDCVSTLRKNLDQDEISRREGFIIYK